MRTPPARTSWRARPAVLAVCFFLGVAGCGESGTSLEPTIAPPEPSEHVAAQAPDAPPARFGELRGLVTLAGAEARRGGAVEPERPIHVPEDGRAVLSLADGARISLEGEARARMVEESAAQLLLVRGAAHMVQPPSGSSPRPPLRLVTPSVTVEIGIAGEAYVVLFEGGSSWVVALNGLVAVSNGEADVRRRLRTVELSGGQAVAVTNRIAEPTEGPRRLSEAREAARALAPPAEAEAERLTREMRNEIQRLDQALLWLEGETRRGRQLTADHGAAVRQSQSAEAQRLQRDLVTHSQALYRLRQLATARWERLRAQWLRLGVLGPLPASDPVAERAGRVTGLLGL